MNYLKITTAAGVQTYIPINYVVQIVLAADAVDAATDNASGRITRGRITDLPYLDGAAAAAPTITSVATIAAFTGANTLYEVGTLTVDGAFQAILSNRNVNF